ncbi:MAG: 5-amino-6-(D-ribitylamino)uracil--L-tyrosine 4-hydroxyphenyl transferase CofH [Alphaproteobacteria bacterium]
MNQISFQTDNRPGHTEALALAEISDTDQLAAAAGRLRDLGHGNLVSYSRKVFIPLTHLCRDVCHYCTFAHPPRKGEAAYLSPEQVLDIARAGERAGCAEALFTLGDKPEARYGAARDALAKLGYSSTLDYLEAMAALVLRETSLLPHLNPGLMNADDFSRLRKVSASMGIMLESASKRLLAKGMAHHGSPDKAPELRLECIAQAGKAGVPFTSGILIGIGETRRERIEALLALRDLHDRYGHIQEIIVQNFRAKPGTRMAGAPEPDLDDLVWTIAVARIVFGPDMSIQAPPNLSPGVLAQLIGAGINDWGGVSPVTPDFVNPEAPWPHLDHLASETASAGKHLLQRLTIYPAYARAPERWLDPALHTRVLQARDSEGFARGEEWSPGAETPPPAADLARSQGKSIGQTSPIIRELIDKACSGTGLSEPEIVTLFQARGDDFAAVCRGADDLRAQVSGEVVRYVVNRNINYTNVCYFKCQFCAFSKGKLSENLRGRPYDLGLDEIMRRTSEAWSRGATEVCMQGGIHPEYTGQTYIDICKAVKQAAPDMHVHAFSPLEVWQGAETLGLPLDEFLRRLMDAGLGSLPGTAAEVLDDEIRAIICPDKINTAQWLTVMETAHGLGIRTTSTIMYGHVDGPLNWARHLTRLRELQARTGGFTEFVPLPFVHMEAPIYLKGRARKGPTFREAILMHAVARLALHPLISNIQASWVKMGPQGISACLQAGANDVGGTLMNETITRAAGAAHGQEMPPQEMEALIKLAGRTPQQRSTVYGDVARARTLASFQAAPLSDPINTPAAARYERAAQTVTR